MREARRLLASRFYMDRAGSAADTVLLLGCARSGTTWLMELINARLDHRVMFEPLFPKHVAMFRAFPQYGYIRPDDPKPRQQAQLHRVMEGRVRHRWIDRHNTAFAARHRLIKMIRASMMTGYLRRAYPDTPMVYVLRHPVAFVLSMLRLGYAQHDVPFWTGQPQLRDDFLQGHEDWLAKWEDRVTYLAVYWAVLNRVALSQLGSGDAHVMLYETLCTEPEAEVTALFSYLGQPMDDRVKAAIDRPSRMSRDRSAIRTGEDLVSGWQKRASAEQVERILVVVEAFGLGGLYTEEAMPNPRVLARLLAED